MEGFIASGARGGLTQLTQGGARLRLGRVGLGHRLVPACAWLGFAAMASFFAMNWGYRNIYFYRDGYFSWLASDFPIDREVALAQ